MLAFTLEGDTQAEQLLGQCAGVGAYPGFNFAHTPAKPIEVSEFARQRGLQCARLRGFFGGSLGGQG